MSALRLLRASFGTCTYPSVARGIVHPATTFWRIPDSGAAIACARRPYASKGKKKEQAAETAAEATAPDANEVESEPATYGATTTTTTPTDDVAAQLQLKQDEIVDLTGRLRYAQADFINLQRISAREKEQTRDFAISRFASDLLETVDTLAMALRSAQQSSTTESTPSTPPLYFQPSSQPPDALLKGIEATHRLLLQTLAKYGVKPFDPTGDKFDPNLHEALYSAPVPGKMPGEVLECQKVGYMIKDRVLRAAQVGIAAEPPSQDKAAESAES